MPRIMRSRRVWTHGSNTFLSTLLFLGILVFVVLIAERHPWRVDLTEAGLYTLSEQSRKIAKAVDQPVTIKGFFQSAEPARLEVEDLLESYRLANKKIRYTFIDPDRNPEEAGRYDIRQYGTLVLEGYDRRQTIQQADEQSITNALFKLMREEQKKIYFVAGHGEHSISDFNQAGYSSVRSALERENYAVQSLSLLQQKGVPEDAAAVVIAGPEKPYFQEEVESLERYVEDGGRLLVLLDPGHAGPLVDWLRKYGIELQDDMVIDKLSRIFGGSYLMPVVTQYGLHDITQGFNVATFYSEARSVQVADPSPEGVHLVTLASTSPNAWAETDLERLRQGEASFDESEDFPGPVPLGVLVQLDPAKFPGRASSEGTSESSDETPEPSTGEGEGGAGAAEGHAAKGYLVVLGDSDFIGNTHFGLSGNGDFFLNIVNFLAEEETLITVEPRGDGGKKTGQPIVLTQDQARTILVLSLGLIPGSVMLLGLGVYRVRRSHR